MNEQLYKVLQNRVPRQYGGNIRKDGEHYICMNMYGSAVISLNKLAGEIYYLIDDKKTINEIVSELVSKYQNMPLSTIQEDVCRCVAELTALNLITVVRRKE